MRGITAALSSTLTLIFASAHAADQAFPPAPTAQQINPFAGFYAAAGGGFGITSGRNISTSSIVFGDDLFDTINAKGWSVFGAGGYNITVGQWLLGVEIDGRFSDEKASTSRTNNFNPAGFVLGTEVKTYDIKNDAGVHLSARFGATFDRTLVFVKAGLGASHITESSISDASNATCLFGGCGAFAGLQSATKSAWIPSALFGAGIEQNFGPIFGRIQGELELASLNETRFFTGSSATNGGNLFWTARAMGAIGVRF